MGTCSMFFAFEFRTFRGSLTMSLQCPFSKLMYLLINKSMECECNLIFSSENSKNPNGSNTFGVFFCSHSKMYNQMYERCTKLLLKHIQQRLKYTSLKKINVKPYLKY